jgi:subtilase family serine protease
VTAWLAGEGFTVTGVANGGTFVTFDGTVAQADAAFGASIHNLSVNGEAHFANITNISVPSAFANVVGAVTGLHDFRPKPRVHTSVATPRFTSSISEDHFVAPGDIYAIYQVSSTLLSAGGVGIGTARTGCTVVAPLTQCGDIAVTGQVDIYLADIAAFRSASGLSATNLPTVLLAAGSTDPGQACTNPNQNLCFPSPNESDLAESSIDLEWSGAMAPSATILFVNGFDVMFNSMTYAVDSDLAPIITTSYGNCEAAWGSTDINTLNQLFKQANAQGQTVLAASADTGAADCDAGPLAEEGVTVDFPGSSPYVTSMGGTQFNEGNATGVTQYWNANSSSSTANAGSATGYIPEQPWNDFPSVLGFSGGGGGFSNFFTKPAWQQGAGVPTDGARDVPDLSLDASDSHDTFLYCVNVAAANGAQSCTSGFRNSSTNLDTAGGTSFDSQIFGGMLALIEQKNGLHGVGNANPTIYALAKNAADYSPGHTIATPGFLTVVFNDVTTGNNQLPCALNTPNCLVGGVIGYSAGSGYDLASGWGSPNVANLASAWTTVTPLSSGSPGPNISSTGLIASTTIATASPTNSPSVTLTATVTGFTVTTANPLVTVPGPTPTGTVQFLVNNAPVGNPVTLNSSGLATYTYNTSCSTLGQQNITTSYSGDVTYAGSVGPALASGEAGRTNGAGIAANGSAETTPLIVTVAAGLCPSFTLSPSTSVPVAAGGTIPPETITLTPVNGFTGTVNFAAYATSTTNQNGYVPTLTLSNSSVNITSSATASTQLTLSGIQADLRMPNAPGHLDSGTMLARQNSGRVPWKLAGSGVTIASLLLLTLPRRRRLGSLLLVVLSVALVGGASGCGSSQAAPPTTTTNSNPYAGTYVVTVVGTYTVSPSQVIQQSSTITYSIN